MKMKNVMKTSIALSRRDSDIQFFSEKVFFVVFSAHIRRPSVEQYLSFFEVDCCNHGSGSGGY